MNNSKTIVKSETIEIIQEVDTGANGSWQPVEGETTRSLRDRILSSGIEEHEWETIKNEAIYVLSSCVEPKASPKQETGLVVGYVQSGKTLSFTTVTALARDNGYQMVIVIAGTSINLLDQSTNRLEEDLSLLTRSDRKWQHFKSSELDKGDYTKIKDVLGDWQDPMVPERGRQTVLITSMKHYVHLEKLVYVLSKIELSKVPILVIDDEADQASLNTKVQKGDTSTTYQRILSLRKHLPHHTFLQYTATPQAPLLINLIDVLSPNFAKVLAPGEKYTGGQKFFFDAPNQICTIPNNEIPTQSYPLDAPPDSLLEAMQIFFLGVSAGMILDEGNGNRSMMVHPSYKTIKHTEYFYWVEQIKKNWLEILELGEDETDYQDLLDDFRNSYGNLQITVPDLPSFEKLATQLLRAIRRTELHEVNSTSGKTPSIPWYRNYAHILVGGQAMDRGFTVEGLTVTYMPRGAGLGNADTIQQRARFFGYKHDYFGYCRVFLEDRIRDAYTRYVTHEEDVQRRLVEHDQTGKPLDAWKRAFFLDRHLKPTRDNVLDLDYIRINSSRRWYTPKAPHDSTEAIKDNRAIVEKFLKRLSFQNAKGSAKRSEFQHHIATDVPLRDVYEQLLVPFRVTRFADSQNFTVLLLHISAYLDSHPDTSCTIYHMSQGKPRKRTLDKRDEIPTLFQGRSPKIGKVTYPGDSNIRGSGVTIQIHNLEIVRENGETFSTVPAIAVWIPQNMSTDWLVQNQGGTETGY